MSYIQEASNILLGSISNIEDRVEVMGEYFIYLGLKRPSRVEVLSNLHVKSFSIALNDIIVSQEFVGDMGNTIKHRISITLEKFRDDFKILIVCKSSTGTLSSTINKTLTLTVKLGNTLEEEKYKFYAEIGKATYNAIRESLLYLYKENTVSSQDLYSFVKYAVPSLNLILDTHSDKDSLTLQLEADARDIEELKDTVMEFMDDRTPANFEGYKARGLILDWQVKIKEVKHRNSNARVPVVELDMTLVNLLKEIRMAV
jgi:hypothetical protein